MHLFYTPDIITSTYTLSEEESKHAIKVLRLQEGTEVQLIDGQGGFYTAKILDAHPKRTELLITQVQEGYGKRNHYLHIAVAPTKNIDRIEWFLEKATEIGIDEITPLICDRSERKEVKIERLEKVITSAVKQSLTAYHPKLNPAVSFEQFLKVERDTQNYIAHCLPEEKVAIKDDFRPAGRYLIMIGPEGDFTQQEIQKALAAGFKPVSLGNTRLRTETAALEACFEINFLNR